VSYSFQPEAEIEYLRAIGFYEDQHPGLGAHLVTEFERTIQRAVKRPSACKVVHATGIRRIDLNRFPYAIFFRTAPAGQVQVIEDKSARSRKNCRRMPTKTNSPTIMGNPIRPSSAQPTN
jgi:hypothetical protein